MKEKILPLLIALALLFLVAPLSLRLGSVPISLQSLVVFTLALSLKPRLALTAVALYLLAGALGLPVFGGYSQGWEKLLGPTAGFLWGFWLCSAFLLWRRQSGEEMHFFRASLWAFQAHALLLILGFTVLAWRMPEANLWASFVPLIPGWILKSIAAGLLGAWAQKKLPPTWTGVS